MCFVWISEQTAIISLYSINWLVCITEKVCVYCEVRTGSLTDIQNPLRLYMFKVVQNLLRVFIKNSVHEFICRNWG